MVTNHNNLFHLSNFKITTYGGLSNAMGQGISKAGSVFPILSPILGWIGVFMTGSVVNNNSLFAPIQASVAQQIGTSGSLYFKYSRWGCGETYFSTIYCHCNSSC